MVLVQSSCGEALIGWLLDLCASHLLTTGISNVKFSWQMFSQESGGLKPYIWSVVLTLSILLIKGLYEEKLI